MKMMQPAVSRRPRRGLEPARRDTRVVKFDRFKHDLDATRLAEFGVRGFDRPEIAWPFGSIETLSPTRTLGRGRTNLTLIEPTIVQVDATVPSATFDRTVSPHRNPVVQAHFEPGPYGITGPATYFMIFLVDVAGQAEFRLEGFHGPGGITNSGTRVLAGRTAVTLIFRDLDPSQAVYGFLEQLSGANWSWYSTRITYPPLVLTM